MQIIPVLDIKDGAVVRAVAGARATYRPLVTPLAKSAAPIDVVAGFMRLHPFETIYVADLDAIERRGRNDAVLPGILAAFPSLRLWVDAGGQAILRERVAPVIGSESLASLEALKSAPPEAVLSLDFRGEEFLGPPDVLADPAAWPPRVIVMTLARVGVRAGPDVGALQAVRARAEGRRIFAAGGVRDRADIATLIDLGVSGALVATALHAGALSAADIDAASSFDIR
jgi:phosphoribosylformimino-5-aminoimidazole carboxamide ribotide isomerase